MKSKFPISYETRGKAENPSIILITGLGGQLIQWSESFINGLIDKNLFVVIFDNRDSGLSKHYDNFGIADFQKRIAAKMAGENIIPPYTLSDMADDILMLMQQLSLEKAHILGSSMGGMIAQSFALKYPDRISSLILIATSSGDVGLPPSDPKVLDCIQGSFSNSSETLDSFIEGKMGLSRLYDPHFFNEAKSRTLFAKMFERNAGKGSDGFKRQLLALISQTPRGEKLRQLTLKSLILHGRLDAAFPLEHGEYLHQVLENSQLEIIEKMGHLVSEELSEEIVGKIGRFMDEYALLCRQTRAWH